MSIGVGIVGLGYWGPNLVRNFFGAAESRVVICCDIRQERCQKVAALYPGIEYTRRADEVLSHPDVDAVAIVTPVCTHYALAKQALDAGKHVMVTKPLTNDVAQAQELVELAE